MTDFFIIVKCDGRIAKTQTRVSASNIPHDKLTSILSRVLHQTIELGPVYRGVDIHVAHVRVVEPSEDTRVARTFTVPIYNAPAIRAVSMRTRLVYYATPLVTFEDCGCMVLAAALQKYYWSGKDPRWLQKRCFPASQSAEDALAICNAPCVDTAILKATTHPNNCVKRVCIGSMVFIM